MNPATERILAGAVNPILRGSLVQALTSRQTILVERLTAAPELIPPLVLLATLAREWKEKDLVDDYTLLLDLAKEQFDATVPEFWHPDLFLVSGVVFNRAEIRNLVEADYIMNAYRELISKEAR